MDAKLLLAKTLTLLFKESLLSSNTSNSSDLAKQIVATIKVPEVAMEHDKSREVIIGLRLTAMWMADNPPTYKYDKSSLHQRICLNCGDDHAVFNAIIRPIEEEVGTEEEIKKIILDYREFLYNYLKQEKVRELLTKTAKTLNFDIESVEWKSYVRDIITQVEPYLSSNDGRKHSSVKVDLDLSDLESVAEVLQTAKDELSPVGALKTGYQGLNRMLGKAGGFRRGEMTVIPALQHNFKSGLMINLMHQACRYNVPHMRDPKKIPMIMRISFENEAQTDLMLLYSTLKELETGQLCDITTANVTEAAAYVLAQMESTGYKVNISRIDPSDFSVFDLFDRITYFESQGYEIHAIFCDYLNMMSKKGCSPGPFGHEIRDLFRRVRNFCSPRGIAFITPHQLSTEAMGLIRAGVDNFVQEIANKNYYDSCKTIPQEVDLEIYIHIEKRGLDSYLTFQRGKHRGVNTTPVKDHYFVMKFHDVGGIIDDVNGRDTSMKFVGGAMMSEGGGPAWFDVK